MTERERERKREGGRNDERIERRMNRRVTRGWWWLLQPTLLFDIQFLFSSSFSFLLLSSLPLLIFLPFFSFSLSSFLSLSVENLMSSWEKKGRRKIVYFVPYNQECGKKQRKKGKKKKEKKNEERKRSKRKERNKTERKNLSWNFFINNWQWLKLKLQSKRYKGKIVSINL